jgi:tetratricopeptide (TPR) repeat protein
VVLSSNVLLETGKRSEMSRSPAPRRSSGENAVAASVLLSQLEQMAEARGDDTERERILKTLIAIDPKRPWPHGNYGWFLLERERYDEAIAEFEKAVALGPYPNVEDGLERARRQRDAVRGRH